MADISSSRRAFGLALAIGAVFNFIRSFELFADQATIGLGIFNFIISIGIYIGATKYVLEIPIIPDIIKNMIRNRF